MSVIAVALCACGGSDDKKSQADTIVMGSMATKTGTFSTGYLVISGSMALAAKTVNDAGGILGKQLVFDEQDEAADTNGVQPVTDLGNLWVDEGIQVWIGPYISDDAATIGKIAGDNQRLMISPLVGSSSYSTIDDHDFAFRGIESPFMTAVVAAVGSYDDGARTAAVLHLNFATGNDLANIFSERFTSLGGTVTVDHAYDFDATNPSSFNAKTHLDAVLGGNPDIVYLYAAPNDAVLLLSAWDSSVYPNWHGKWVLGPILGDPQIAQAVGAAKMNGTMVYTALPVDAAKQAIVTDAFKELNGFSITNTTLPVVNSILNSVYLGALAIEQAGVNDGTAARDALRVIANAPGEAVDVPIDFAHALQVVQSGGDLDYQSLTSTVEYDANGDFSADLGKYMFDANGNLQYQHIMPTAGL